MDDNQEDDFKSKDLFMWYGSTHYSKMDFIDFIFIFFSGNSLFKYIYTFAFTFKLSPTIYNTSLLFPLGNK